MRQFVRWFTALVMSAVFIFSDAVGQGLTWVNVQAETGTGSTASASTGGTGTAAGEADEAGYAATQLSWPGGPDISADGAIVIEANTGSILYQKNIYDRFYPASTTKILTTLVALENSELNEIVTVSYAADNYVSKTSSRMGLVEGEQLTMEQALYGIMLESANEATYAVGEHVGGSIARFIKMMNAKAESLGCEHSHFANSHGLHDEDHYTCPYDLALIARDAYKNETFMEITGTATYAMPETNKNPARLLTNHHWFLNKTMRYDYCIGGKTGATTQAGYALVTYAKKDGMTVIAVVMHAETWAKVYNDTKTLLDYTFDTFKTYKMSDLVASDTEFPSMFDGSIARFTENRSSILYNSDTGVVILPDSVEPEETFRSVSLSTGVEIGSGENLIGSITYTYGDKVVGMTDIVYYNTDDPMTETKFNQNWPSFMIPVDVAFEGVDIGSLSQEDTDAAPQLSDYIDLDKAVPIAIGAGAGLTALLIGLAVAALIRKYR